MRRRDFLGMAVPLAVQAATPPRITVPVHRILDVRVKDPQRWPKIWNEAVQDYRQGGIDFDVTDGPGEVRLSAADNPIFVGLRGRAINVVVTETLPMYWDAGRALAGMSTIHDGYHVCMIALRYAHGNQVAFVSVNTCLHEILHVLLQDIFIKPPKWYQASGREMRVDYYATRLWLFHDGEAVRKSAESYLKRLQGSRL
jgi:hypothetical protein